MALSIKNPRVEELVEEITKLTGETKTEAIRKALVERRERLSFQMAPRDRAVEIEHFLEREVWSRIPPSLLGRRMSRKEKERILGYGPRGV